MNSETSTNIIIEMDQEEATELIGELDGMDAEDYPRIAELHDVLNEELEA